MPAIPGTIVAALLTSGNTANTFAVTDQNEGRGGVHSVATLVDRDAITTDRRVEGLICYVVATGTNYQLKGGITNANWVPLTFGTGGNLSIEFRAAPVALNDPSVEPAPVDATKNTIVYFLDLSPWYIWNAAAVAYVG